MLRLPLLLLSTLLPVAFVGLQAQTLEVALGKTHAIWQESHPAQDPQREVRLSLNARLTQADSAAAADGKLTLRIVSEYGLLPSQPQARLVIEIPLSSTAEAYGESRSCSVAKDGATTLVFTAGLDEKNFVPFAASDKNKHFEFLLNKYLCRALAATFSCESADGTRMQQSLPKDMAHWKVGVSTVVELDSTNAPARTEVSPVTITASGKPFDYATCEKIAPSNGMCCVEHKSTQWHCGGTPVGDGWHRVSGDCFHRETGASCSE
jgi:hypothetical protein